MRRNTIRGIKVGDVITAKDAIYGETGRKSVQYVDRDYVVKCIYPYMVLAETRDGMRRCFSYGDLIVCGIENQGRCLEDLRAERANTCRSGKHAEGHRKKNTADG